MSTKPTLLGHVGAVNGGTINVLQSPSVSSGIAIIGGKSYRIGQVGSFIRIPQGYQDLFGIVAQVGANAAPAKTGEGGDHGDRWMTVQLVGESIGASFERGISQYPSVRDEVHLVTEEDLLRLYGSTDSGQVIVGRLANAEGIPVRVDISKLVTRHCAVLGSTGSGKSTTVASLLRSIALGSASDEAAAYPSARILLIDIHGEYHQALQSVSVVFRANATAGQRPLHVPYWAVEIDEVLRFVMGRLDDKPLSQIRDRVFEMMMERAAASAIEGVDIASMTADTPIPYSLKQLWYELIDPEIRTWDDKERTRPALVEEGDADTLRAPKYKPHSTGNTAPFINQINVLGIRRQLEQLRLRLLDRRYDFLLHPGPWEPKLDGAVDKDIPDLLSEWLGHDRPITILDLSGIPSQVLIRMIGAILNIVCESVFWAREKSEGGINRPILVVMEEAHRYLSGGSSDAPACAIVQRIVKEGRKFGIGAMIVSQRPSEVDETILSQCGTFVALRLSNSADRNKVQAALPDSLAGIVDSLPVLRTGEAIITGEAARLPVRCRITLPSEEHRPNSGDPEVARRWREPRALESYQRVAASWRSQNPLWAASRPSRTSIKKGSEPMERDSVSSSSIASIGYDNQSEILEIEFTSGSVYQYYNVPFAVHRQLMESGSKGEFHANYIKNAFPFSRV